MRQPRGRHESIRLCSVSLPYTVVSLYSGAGGFDRGFVVEGFRVEWANDIDPWACKTYVASLGQTAVCGDLDVAAIPNGLSPDVVIGGPPCQGFSVAGRMDPADERSRHIFRFLDVVERLSPKVFVMENVKALGQSTRWLGVRGAFLLRARALGYSVELFVLRATDFGVAQLRERVFFVGVPYPGTPPNLTPVEPVRRVSAGEVLRALPEFGSAGNDSRCGARVVPARRPVLRPSPYSGSLLFNGSGRPLCLDEPAKTLPASMSGNATPIVDELELRQGERPWVEDYHASLIRGEPPLAVAPARLRRITVEEASALQGFPTGMAFMGPTNARYRQIGNSVPPPLAQHIARVVKLELDRQRASV